MGIKLFTVLSMILLYVIIAVNWGVFLLRVIGLCRQGQESSMTVDNEALKGQEDDDNYSELEDQKPVSSMHTQNKSSKNQRGRDEEKNSKPHAKRGKQSNYFD